MNCIFAKTLVMKPQENTDYLLFKSAIRVDGAITNQHKGNLFITKKFIMLNVSHNMDLMETAFGETGHEHEYKDDQTLNPFKNIAAGVHNVGVAGKEVKESFRQSKAFYALERLVKENYKLISEKAAGAESIEALEETVRQMCIPNELSLVLRVDQIAEIKSGFFKVWFNGFKVLMRDGQQFKVIFGSTKKMRNFIGK